MRRTALLALVLIAAAAHGREIGDDSAFVEATTSRTTVYVGEHVRIALAFGVEADVLAENVVPLFRRPLDLHLQVAAPWTTGLDDPDPGDISIALEGSPVGAHRRADRVIDGRTFTVHGVERLLVPETPGTLALSAPELRIAVATRFHEDFVNGRVPTDRSEINVVGAPLEFDVRALPETGRPDAWNGAIGRFSLTAEADRTNVDVRDTLRVTLRISGEGNLATFDPPVLDTLAGLHVVGTLDDRGAATRTVIYELLALDSGELSVPAIELPSFDPESGAYATARSTPISLAVASGDDPLPTPREAATPPTATEDDGLPFVPIALGLAALLLLTLVLRLRQRQEPASPPHANRDAALAAVHGATDGDLARAFAAYLATVLECEPAAVISPDLEDRLLAERVDAQLARDTAELMERLVATGYGGRPVGPADRERATALADRFDREHGRERFRRELRSE